VEQIEYCWRGALTDAEMVELVKAHGGSAQAGWWDQVRPHCLGWVTARSRDGLLVGFVNEWLHVDFEERLAPFYFDPCGFRPTAAGLINLRGPEHG
jgi:hypothetical protein